MQESNSILLLLAAIDYPRLPDFVRAESTQTTITVYWSFNRLGRTTETISIIYGTMPGNLSMSSLQIISIPDLQEYSIHLISLKPGTTYYYQLLSSNQFATTTDDVEHSINTLDGSEQNCILVEFFIGHYGQANNTVHFTITLAG